MSEPTPVTPCPSSLRWDAWDAGELSDQESTAVLAHARTCIDCTERVEALRQRRAEFQAAPPFAMPRPDQVPEASPRPSAGRRWGGLVVAVVGVAAGVALLVLVGDPQAPGVGAGHGVTAKGAGAQPPAAAAGLQLELHIDSAAGRRALSAGAAVTPGSRIGFKVRASRAAQMSLSSVDGSGHRDALWTGTVQAGEAVLPVAAELDEVLGPTVFELRAEPASAGGKAGKAGKAGIVEAYVLVTAATTTHGGGGGGAGGIKGGRGGAGR